MAFYSFYVFPTSDFTTLDFGDISNLGSITTGSSLNPITVTVDDDDAGFTRVGFDSTPGTIVSADPATPSIIGATISSQGTGTDSANYEMDAVGGSERIWLIDLNGTDYVISTFLPEVSTTYTEGTTGYSVSGSYNSIICFTRGTLIKTGLGETPVEDLSVGDCVLTMEHGHQPIRWIGSRSLGATQLAANPKLSPIRIRAGALGMNMPERDLSVSPQHRVFVRSKVAMRMFGSAEVLIPANKLLPLPGIGIESCAVDVTYFHILFDTHQIIWSNGALTESLFPGPVALKTVSPEARSEIRTLFPGICRPSFVPRPARTIPSKGKRAKELVRRLLKNKKAVVEGADSLRRNLPSVA